MIKPFRPQNFPCFSGFHIIFVASCTLPVLPSSTLLQYSRCFVVQCREDLQVSDRKVSEMGVGVLVSSRCVYLAAIISLTAAWPSSRGALDRDLLEELRIQRRNLVSRSDFRREHLQVSQPVLKLLTTLEDGLMK